MTTAQTEPSAPLPTVEEPERKKSKGFPFRIVVVVIASMVVGGIIYGVSQAAFTGSTAVRANVSTGTVVLTNDATGSTLINVSGLTAGDTVRSCVNVHYTGTIPGAAVGLFGAPASTGPGANDLDQYLNLMIESGTDTAGDTTCTSFVPAAQPIIYQAGTPSGAGGTLQTFLATYPTFSAFLDTGWVAPPGGLKAFRFSFTVQNTDNAQGKTSSPIFTWRTAPASSTTTGATLPAPVTTTT
jgi:hypothetical protein